MEKKQKVFDRSTRAWQEFAQTMPTLTRAWIESVKSMGDKMTIADTLGQSLSASRALTAAIVFSRRIAAVSSEQNVGLLLPTSSAGVIANMAALLAGKTIVNLNYTASREAVASSIEQAGLQTICTSRRFISKLNRRGIDILEYCRGPRIIYLEDIKDEVGKAEMLATLLAVKILPAWCLNRWFNHSGDPRKTATILFSSGSEGLPKGIELSHQNIMINIKQTAAALNAESDDVIMASLPLFHAFGLTVTQFMPLIEGLSVICHPDPTDGQGVAQAVVARRATILCGTPTFLRLYARDNKVRAPMFESLRLVVSGAEKLGPEVRNVFERKFGKTIYEGYGVTETSPVASVNLPDKLDHRQQTVQTGSKPGTVGMPLPGTSFKIVDPDNFKELAVGRDGMILIGGPQIMQGYLNDPVKTEKVIRTIAGVRWYVTGDKGHLDGDGFLTIIDRYSRFAKLGGEMIGLREVETAVLKSLELEEVAVVAVNLPDGKKGERIVLLSEQPIELTKLRKAMLNAGCNPLLIPAEVTQIDALPKLGSGKTDFFAAKRLAGENRQGPDR